MKTITFLILMFMLTATDIFSQTTAPPLETGVSQDLAKWRAANYSNVRYKLNITLEKGAPLMRGTIEIRVDLTEEGRKNDLVLDWRTTQFQNDKEQPYAFVTKLNMLTSDPSKAAVPVAQTVNEHLILPKNFLKTGENIIQISFASPIKTSGSAITRYVDKEDGAEYIYSLFVPSDASTAFPVFDQPDLKARFQLNIDAPSNWKVVSNTTTNGLTIFGQTHDPNWQPHTITKFKETQSISTYVFAFAAGEFAAMSEPSAVADGLTLTARKTTEKGESENSNAAADKLKPSATADGSDLSTKIYVRKSQAEKFKQHSAEVFRLNREGVKFLESYFDYKFPFSKYDLVLIPEFPFGGMEHAGATFLRETSVIFPTEPTKNDYVSRANLIFHEAAHQWFGDTVTMKWFDDLWLKEGFAEFMAYKTLEKVMPEYNAWKIFYERNKQAAYLTDSTRGTTPIYQEIPNLSSAKSAYGNIVYRKAPSFLKQAEFYLGEKDFQIAVRAFLKKHEFANAEWTDLVKEFIEVKIAELKSQGYYQKFSGEGKASAELAKKKQINDWANVWVNYVGMPLIQVSPDLLELPYETKDIVNKRPHGAGMSWLSHFWQRPAGSQVGSQEAINTPDNNWTQNIKVVRVFGDGTREEATVNLGNEFYGLSNIKLSKRGEYKFTITEEESRKFAEEFEAKRKARLVKNPLYIFPNYQDYGYGIFLLDEKSRAYVLANIQTEKDDFLRAMMWGSLWDSVREGELDPKEYVELVIKNLNVETDESTIQTLLGRTSTAMNYYLSEPSAVADGLSRPNNKSLETANAKLQPSATADGSDLSRRLETLLIEKMQNAPTVGQKITFYRAFLNVASSENARKILKSFSLDDKVDISRTQGFQIKTKDKFDIVTRLLVLGDKDAPQLLAELEKSETSDEAKRYAYAAKAGIGTAENKAKFWNDFVNNKEISESYIEAAFVSFNSSKHAELTLPYLEKALTELPNLKRNRKIFFVNGWLASFIGGQKSEAALKIINDFLAKNPNLDKDLRLKILENSDTLERAVKIRGKFKQ